MGGYSSGRRGRRADARDLVEDAPRLDVHAAAIALQLAAPDGYRVTIGARGRRWTLAACAELDDDGPPGAACACTFDDADDIGATSGRVELAWIRVGYGWRCYWRCPTCAARVRHVYAPTGRAGLWTCRRCARLAYLSTRRPVHARAERRARLAAADLGAAWAWTCTAEALANAPDVLPRPPGMKRRAVYLPRLARWMVARQRFAAALAAELARG